MKIFFIVTGIGYGEATREHAVINAFLKKDPKTEILIAAYDCSYEYFKGKFNLVKITGYKFPFKKMKFKLFNFLAKNYFLPLAWFASILKIKKIVKKFNPDIIISDFEPIGPLLAKLTRKKCVMVFGFDPVLYKRFRKKTKALSLQAKYLEKTYATADYIIIPSFFNSKKDKKYFHVNPIVRKRPDEVADKAKLMKKLKLKKEPILVMLGGSGFGEILIKKINAVADKFDENFIVFGNVKFKPKRNIKCLGVKTNFFEYLKVSKCVITLAGHLTLSECLVFGKPMLIFPIQNHVEQLLNAFSLERFAVVKYDLNDMEDSIKRFLVNFNKMKKQMPQIKSNGASQIVDIIYSFV